MRKYCRDCGRDERTTTFRSPKAILCNDCTGAVREYRRRYHAAYHLDRDAVLRQIVAENQARYDELLREVRGRRAVLERIAAAFSGVAHRPLGH